MKNSGEMIEMRWRDWQQEIEYTKVIVYYGSSNLYPISEWLHPGTLPIGTGLNDDIRQDLPNLDWIVRHLTYLGFRDITIVSHQNFKGLDRFYRNFNSKLNIEFTHRPISDLIKEFLHLKNYDVMFLSGLIPTNADLRHSLILHRQRNNTCSLLSIRGLKFRIGIADVDDNLNITEFKEKPLDNTLLINSNITIINNDLLNNGNNIDEILDKIDENKLSIENIINQILSNFVKSQVLSAVELTGVKGKPWFIDLSQLETWVKLDHDGFIEQFSHLVTE